MIEKCWQLDTCWTALLILRTRTFLSCNIFQLLKVYKNKPTYVLVIYVSLFLGVIWVKSTSFYFYPHCVKINIFYLTIFFKDTSMSSTNIGMHISEQVYSNKIILCTSWVSVFSSLSVQVCIRNHKVNCSDNFLLSYFRFLSVSLFASGWVSDKTCWSDYLVDLSTLSPDCWLVGW